MNIPNEWVEKAVPRIKGVGQYDYVEEEIARVVIEAALPDILEAVAQEIDKRTASSERLKERAKELKADLTAGRFLVAEASYEQAARIVRNFGDSSE